MLYRLPCDITMSVWVFVSAIHTPGISRHGIVQCDTYVYDLSNLYFGFSNHQAKHKECSTHFVCSDDLLKLSLVLMAGTSFSTSS